MCRNVRGLIWLAFFLAIFGCDNSNSGEKQPNIILIISDDQGWGDYGFMDHSAIETPFLDSLARNSLCFTHGYCTAPLCSPSLASMITGLYAHQHGITGNDPAFEFDGQRYGKEWLNARQDLFDTLKSNFYKNKLLTQYLAEAGYRTLQTGKWWLGSWQEGHFDAGMTHGNPEEGGRHGDEGLKIGREGLNKIFDFIDASDEPFFIWYAPFLPHTPHTPPDSLLQKYLNKTSSEFVARYWAMCEWFDQTCSELVSFMDQRSLSGETLIIYTADNGWIQKRDENGFAERSKRSPYEYGIRTPIMLHWPGKIEPRLIDSIPASNIDLVPTILAAAGLSHDTLPGKNLLQLDSERRIIYSEAFEHDIRDINDPAKSLQYQVAIEYPWKLILPNVSVMPEEVEPELYNLAEDPDEKINLADKNSGKTNR
ncbi:MAG: sulfatase-like hydrolase/transferase, partial [Saprospiraceae bacterium]|nr:sulfatase-like hydrolase/transferase [Saprospiraceae bacterium]